MQTLIQHWAWLSSCLHAPTASVDTLGGLRTGAQAQARTPKSPFRGPTPSVLSLRPSGKQPGSAPPCPDQLCCSVTWFPYPQGGGGSRSGSPMARR